MQIQQLKKRQRRNPDRCSAAPRVGEERVLAWVGRSEENTTDRTGVSERGAQTHPSKLKVVPTTERGPSKVPRGLRVGPLLTGKDAHGAPSSHRKEIVQPNRDSLEAIVELII